ncbi:hypothetical protein ACEXQD_06030 [Herbiconiux sp. P15]|uniref:hypothetical protein n=1 Tax=Herbiconiux liukaitaii TaxID=3342799 RepID=UPI0035B9A94E
MTARENDDRMDDLDLAQETVTNDAVAGETVFSGEGEGNDGPTGGAPGEAEPDWENYAPGVAGEDESQPVGDKAPDDLRDSDR